MSNSGTASIEPTFNLFYRVCAASLFCFLALKSEGGAMQLRLKTDGQTDRLAKLGTGNSVVDWEVYRG